MGDHGFAPCIQIHQFLVALRYLLANLHEQPLFALLSNLSQAKHSRE